MAATLDELLSTAPDRPQSLDELLATATSPQSGPRAVTPERRAEFDAWNNQDQSMPWYKRAAHGVGDPLVGLGQLAQNVVPDAAMNVMRKAGASMASAVGADEFAATMEKPTSTDQFNAGVRRMEQGYQAERENAGEEGLDGARIVGNVANPLSWVGAAKANTVMQAVKVGAKTGAFQALLQPVTDKGNFIYSKGMQLATGATLGGALGGAVQALKSPLGFMVGRVREAFNRAEPAAAAAAATQAADQVLVTAGIDPKKMDPNLYSSIQREVMDALKTGADIDPKVIVNRADAASLPVPMQLTRGQSLRDPMQFSWEVNNAKLRGAGEPLTEMLANQNRQLVENINALGAAKAASPFDVSKQVISRIDEMDAAARAKIDAAYQQVRDSAGRPALMDHITFVDKANDALDTGQLGPFLPTTIRDQLNDIAAGKLPLTVNVAQQLDKVWSAAQRGTQDGSAKMAIGQLRDALNTAPVSDSLGEASMQAYKAARAMARERFAAIEAHPAYKAVVDGVEPDRFFQKYIAGGDASSITGLKQLVGPELSQSMRDTTVANLKSAALNRASDENGVFSQAAYNKLLQDPVFAPRLQAMFADAPATLDQLYRLGRVSENIIAFPKGHSVNTSNTTPTAANLVRDLAKGEVEGVFDRMFPVIGGLKNIARQAKVQAEVSKQVDRAVKPGVSSSEPKLPQRSLGRLSDLAARTSTVAHANEERND